MPVQTEDVRRGVIAARDRGKTAGERIDADVSAAGNGNSRAAESGVAAGTGLGERDSKRRPLRTDSDNPLECPSRGRTRNGDHGKPPCHLLNDTARVAVGVLSARPPRLWRAPVRGNVPWASRAAGSVARSAR